MSKIQISAKIKIPKDMLEEFKQHAAECIKQVKEKDSETKRRTVKHYNMIGFLVVITVSVKCVRYTKVPRPS